MFNNIQWPRKWKKSVFVTTMLLCGFYFNAHAQRPIEIPTSGLPGYYQSSYSKVGIIRETRPGNIYIISGLKYNTTSSTKIHSQTSQFATAWALKVGEEVGFSFTTDANNRRTISEIWLLPKGSVKLY